jgi:predicted MFS family arabinose efflux permease
VKWFPAAKTGLISSLVVSGFGLASVYAAPLTRYLINTFNLQTAFIIWGIAFLCIVVGLSMFLKAPPPG